MVGISARLLADVPPPSPAKRSSRSTSGGPTADDDATTRTVSRSFASAPSRARTTTRDTQIARPLGPRTPTQRRSSGSAGIGGHLLTAVGVQPSTKSAIRRRSRSASLSGRPRQEDMNGRRVTAKREPVAPPCLRLQRTAIAFSLASGAGPDRDFWSFRVSTIAIYFLLLAFGGCDSPRWPSTREPRTAVTVDGQAFRQPGTAGSIV